MPPHHRLSALLAALAAFLALMPAVLAGEAAPAKQDAMTNEELAAILAAQPAEVKERYGARHPAETLAFFDIRKGDVVIEAFPGGGWYSGILYPALGENGKLIAAHYPRAFYERRGWDKDRLQRVLDRDAGWAKTTESTAVAKGGAIESFALTEMPDRFAGVADKVLFIRALHNLARDGKETGYLEMAIGEAYRSLKPGGIAGVVQHRAQESAPEAWADGNNGYLKQSAVIRAFEAAGFKLIEASEINANPKDRPTQAENVWRLPPTLRGLEKDSDAWRAATAIGESDRMTLKFVKP